MSGTYRAIQVAKLSKTIEEGIANLVINDIPRKKLRDSEVRISMKSGAVNYFDLLIMTGRYQHKPQLPYTIGSEGSGVISEVGAAVSNFKVGDEVMIGMTGGGCMAEEMVVSSRALLPKPPGFTHPESASMFVGYSTAFHGLIQRGRLKKGEVLLVTGAAGGMGMAAVQLGKLMGATVIAAVSSPDKEAAAKRGGADYTVNYKQDDLKKKVREITKGKMCDVVYEIVGGDIFKKCISCMATRGGGRLLVIGFASGTIPSCPANLALVKGFDLVGVRAGMQMGLFPELTAEMATRLREWTAKGERHLAPIVKHTYSLDNFRKAFEVLNERKVVGKACISFGSQNKSKL